MGQMKNYRQILNEMPSKTVVFAFGRFQPPHIGHELLVKLVAQQAQAKRADHVIYVSKTQDKKKNPLPADRKVHYLKMMFPRINFRAATPTERTFLEAAKFLNRRYKNIIMIAGSDRYLEFRRLLNEYNGKDFKFDNIQVISSGQRDPDSEGAAGMTATKVRDFAVKGNIIEFKKALPSTMRDIDARRLMNDIRMGMGMQAVREQVVFKKDQLREQYFSGQIFNIGDIVESNGEVFKIVNRGSNHLLVQETNGEMVSKWIQDVQPTERQFMLNEALTQKTLKQNDKIKVGRVIANMLGVDNAESMSNPTQLVNMGLRNIRKKALNKAAIELIQKMVDLAKDMGIDYDKNLLPNALKESIIQPSGTSKIDMGDSIVVDPKSKRNIAKDILRYKDFKKLSKMQEDEIKDTESDFDAENQDMPAHTETGGLMNPPYNTTDDNLRRRKVMYQRHEETDPAAKAKKERDKAAMQMKHAREKEALARKQEQDKERMKNESVDLEENAAVKKKAEKSGVSYGTLMKVYKRGVAAWNSGHRPGTTPQQWGLARVNSYVTKGKGTYHGADKDLREQDEDLYLEEMKSVPKDKDTGLAKKYVAGLSKSTAAARKAHWNKADKLSDKDPEAYKPAPGDATAKTKPSKYTKKFKDMYGEACWDTHKQVGMKKKGNKMVPDCVPKTEEVETESQKHARWTADLNDLEQEIIAKGQMDSEMEAAIADRREQLESMNVNEAVEMCPDACCGKPVTECTCGPDCKHCDCYEKNKMNEDYTLAKMAMTQGVDPIDVDDVNAAGHEPTDEDFANMLSGLDKDIEAELNDIVNSTSDDELIDLAYDDDELEEVDEETGEVYEMDEEEKELNESLMQIEGLSRIERIKARQRLKRTAAKRKRSINISMKRISSAKTANARARRAAIKKVKQRVLRGRSLSKLSVGEKERVEKFVAKKKGLINRLAMKMLPRVRQLEKKRMANARKKR